MSLEIGIVGLPNVGKSTLFNAITNSQVEAANYPFCTIEPNTGTVPIPDERLDVLSQISQTEKIIHATISFVDIAGLVKGASKGEGLGNQFLGNIRSTAAIAHVIRCFEDENIIHVNGAADPIGDIKTIELELILADLDSAQKSLDNQLRKSKNGQKEEVKKAEFLQKVVAGLSTETCVRHLEFTDEETKLLDVYPFITAKRMIYVANISEEMIGHPSELVKQVQAYATEQGDPCIVLCAKLESELAVLSDAEKKSFLNEVGIPVSGLTLLSRACFDLLGLQTYLTTGVKETRAWTIKKGDRAPQAAGVIHTDFEKGFIRANIVSYEDFVSCNGLKTAKEKGLIRQEGKDYVMQDGDVVEFLFNV
jgi:GTP-binding protein YchF